MSTVNGFLLDTTALIDFFRGREGMFPLLERLREQAPHASCPITLAEVYAGAKEKELSQTDSFLTALQFYPITPASSRRAGRWRYSFARQGVTISLADAMIAAVSAENNLVLVTRNRNHFPMEGLLIKSHKIKSKPK